MYDIVIIGAGPAGSTLARQISKSKKKILIIDAENEKNKKPCGGLLAPDAQKEFAHYDLVLPKDILVSPQIFSVKTMDLVSGKIKYYQRYYLNMDRYKFDKYLVSLIPNNVKKINGRVVNIKKDDNYIIEVLDGTKKKLIKSKIIVGADGCNSIVRRTFYDNNIMKYMAIQEWYKCVDSSNSFYSCIFDKKTSSSCSWLIHKDEYLIYGGAFDIKNSKDKFLEQRERISRFLNIDLNNPVKKEACLVYRPNKFNDFVTGKDGAYLVGEAAGFISASSFEGISSAIRSADILSKIINDNVDIKKITKLYRNKTIKLKIKLRLKVIKRWFMYTSIVRNIIMTLGIDSIKINK